MTVHSSNKVKVLLEKGIEVPNPESVEIGSMVDLNRISGDGVTIYAGCKIYGRESLIMPNVKLGYESPVTLRDCQLGPDVELKGGFFRKSTFLKGANMGSGAQVRDGCLLEEEANGAHTVGLKQTILFPFVTFGSLINFCDGLMAGGTSRKNHTEVGSSYIHFNYTPNQDKATPSLIGDVPRGVMLNQSPIFLGGQGGLVGPCRIGYGTVVAAGTICRMDCPEGGKLLFGGTRKSGDLEFCPGVYRSVRRRVVNNIIYIANLIALRQWYIHVRSLFHTDAGLGKELHQGAMEKIEMGFSERIKRLGALVAKMPASAESYKKIMDTPSRELLDRKNELFRKWPQVEEALKASAKWTGDISARDSFLDKISRDTEKKGNDYIAVIQGLEPEWSEKGTSWLQGIVNEVTGEIFSLLPSFKTE